MHATAVLPLRPQAQAPRPKAAARRPQASPPASRAAPGEAEGGQDSILRTSLGEALLALAAAQVRADRAERRLRSRLVELTWPAVAGGFAGGFAAVAAVRWAGL